MSLLSALSAIWNDTEAVFMNAGYSFFKIEAHVVCAIVLIILLYRQQNSSDQTETRVMWGRFLIVQILYSMAGIIRVLEDTGIIPESYAVKYTVTAITLVLFSAMSWLVLVYTETYQNSALLRSRRNGIIIALPFVFNVIMLTVSGFFPGMLVDFSGRTFTRGILYHIMMLINFAYPLGAIFLSVRRRRRMTRYERDASPVMTIFFCPAFFMICGPLQDINWRVPFLSYVMLIADIFVYMSYADSLISVDPLTKIPNNNALMEKLSERLSKGNSETLHIFSVDVNALSQINASHGRTEGDKVLVMIANALKKFSLEEHKCEVFRYYGDEFILMGDVKDDEERELFTEHIRNYVSNAAMSTKCTYHVSISIGWSKYEQYSKTETISGLIDEAERMLNEAKEQHSFQKIWLNA